MKLKCMKLIKVTNLPGKRKENRRRFGLLVSMNTVYTALKDNQ